MKRAGLGIRSYIHMAVQEENNSLHKKLKGIYMLGEKS